MDTINKMRIDGIDYNIGSSSISFTTSDIQKLIPENIKKDVTIFKGTENEIVGALNPSPFPDLSLVSGTGTTKPGTARINGFINWDYFEPQHEELLPDYAESHPGTKWVTDDGLIGGFYGNNLKFKCIHPSDYNLRVIITTSSTLTTSVIITINGIVEFQKTLYIDNGYNCESYNKIITLNQDDIIEINVVAGPIHTGCGVYLSSIE